MKKILFLAILSIALTSCGGAKKNFTIKESSTYKYKPAKKATKIADYALQFQGTKYKWGGTTKRGMDCSGLVYTSFLNAGNIELPRSSYTMVKKGRRLRVDEINIGDLLFFKTYNNRHAVSHVGLVVKIVPGQVSFIHSTTHKGVIISTLNQKYWNAHFVEARRLF